MPGQVAVQIVGQPGEGEQEILEAVQASNATEYSPFHAHEPKTGYMTSVITTLYAR